MRLLKIIRRAKNNMDFQILKDNNIDIQAGISYCGDEAKYIASLQRYYRLYESNFTKMRECIQGEQLQEFTILVHALKSNSKMIGANELSQFAATMEAAGKAGDLETIKGNFDDLIEKYRGTIEVIKVYGEMPAVKIPGVLSEQEALKVAEELMSALDDYDGDSAMSLMEEFLKFPFRITVKQRLKEAKAYIAEYLFDDAMAIVGEAVKEIQ